MRYPLLTLLVEDGNGVGQLVTFCIASRDDQPHVEHLLKYFSDNNDTTKTQVVIIDKDMAEYNAVRACWPHCRVMFCYFHIMRAVDRHLSCLKMSSENLKVCAEVRQTKLSYLNTQ
jgi:transposase-like protein